MTELFALFLEKLDDARIDYVITGSVACIVYGEPRMTHDLDLVLALSRESIPRLVAQFPATDFYVPPVEVLRVEAERSMRGHFNLIHHESGFKADVYIVGRDPLHVDALARRRQLQLGRITVSVAPPDYVILRKLEFFREGGIEKHLRDIAGILEHSADLVDMDLLQERIARRGLQLEWSRVVLP